MTQLHYMLEHLMFTSGINTCSMFLISNVA